MHSQKLFSAKGIHADWDQIGTISACIDHLFALKKRIVAAYGTAYSGNTHKTPDGTASLVNRISEIAREKQLQKENTTRPKDLLPKRVIDARRVGLAKFKSSGLAAFNKKIEAKKTGTNVDVEDELDEIPPVDIILREDSDDDE